MKGLKEAQNVAAGNKTADPWASLGDAMKDIGEAMEKNVPPGAGGFGGPGMGGMGGAQKPKQAAKKKEEPETDHEEL